MNKSFKLKSNPKDTKQFFSTKNMAQKYGLYNL